MKTRVNLRRAIVATALVGAMMLGPLTGAAAADEGRSSDPETTLADLLAESAAILSFYQDQIANEAYLETARQRASLTIQVRLLDHGETRSSGDSEWRYLNVRRW